MKSCVVGIVKNEVHSVFEWALYHAFNGFDAVLIYNNNSSDGTAAEVERASKFADIRLIDWPLHPGQIQAYDDAITRFRSEFDTFCMLDADEFLLPLKHADCRDFLASVAKFEHVAVHWVMYGSSGHISRPSGLVTKTYTYRAKRPNNHIKTIYRPNERKSNFINPHFMLPSRYVNAAGEPVTWNPRKPGGKAISDQAADIARVNHYYTKSREDYDQKLLRGKADGHRVRKNSFAKWDKNELHDTVIIERFGHVLSRIESAAALGVQC